MRNRETFGLKFVLLNFKLNYPQYLSVALPNPSTPYYNTWTLSATLLTNISTNQFNSLSSVFPVVLYYPRTALFVTIKLHPRKRLRRPRKSPRASRAGHSYLAKPNRESKASLAWQNGSTLT
ncbi:hypothetical protein MJO29_006265 [Puccinia striiformis f. sp. tritici]|nr:hypothetical protein MJO29_006265 [Puccinia striiformis f. sp. tritici]